MQTLINQFQHGVLGALWPSSSGVPSWIFVVGFCLVGAGAVLAWMALMALAWTYGERRIAGFIQVRLGPNRVGPQGILQPLADGIKLFMKEDVIPDGANRFLYIMAPLLVFLGAMIPFAVLPLSERLVVSNMELALYYILGFEAIEVIGVLMAGWASGSKWSLYGGMRLAAQLLSYEIPLGLCVLVIIMLSGSLNLGEIVAWQAGPAFFGAVEHPWIFGWAIFRSPAAFVAFFLFFIGGMASAKRAPFDLPEAESELVAGYHTEYSGLRFSFFFMAEYASMYIICALAAILFLGGWHGPIPRWALPEDVTIIGQLAEAVAQVAPEAGGFFGKLWALAGACLSLLGDAVSLKIVFHQLIGVANLLMKAFFLYFVMIWVRWTLPRIRIDQVMYLCLKVLLPFALGCVVWAAFQTVLQG